MASVSTLVNSNLLLQPSQPWGSWGWDPLSLLAGSCPGWTIWFLGFSQMGTLWPLAVSRGARISTISKAWPSLGNNRWVLEFSGDGINMAMKYFTGRGLRKIFCTFFFFFGLFRVILAAYEDSQDGAELELWPLAYTTVTATATRDPSLRPTPQLMAMPDP